MPLSLTAKTRADLGWDTLIHELSLRARTFRGAQLCRALAPLPTRALLEERLAEVAEARALRDTSEGLSFDGVREIDEALRRVGKSGALDSTALVEIASTLAAGSRLRAHVEVVASRVPRLAERTAGIEPLDELWQTVEGAFEGMESTGPEGLSRPRLSDRASPLLGSLRRRAHTLREELERTVEGLLQRGHIAPHLQDVYATQRDDRYVIPVRSDARAKVRGILHGFSQSGQTVFIEPEEIVDLNNALKLADLEVADEERRILALLSEQVEAALPAIARNLEVLALLDLIDACAHLGAELRATTPELVEAEPGALLDLRRARHPLMVLGGRACVPNDVVLRLGQAMVVSGPNAGGKTVAMKTAGLAALMAAHGLPIAAQEGSTVPLFTGVLTDVGDDQSLERNLSTFSAHVLSLKSFLEAAGPAVLILLDEIAVGTDPDQGAALAQAVLESLGSRGATVIVTTHYDRLKALAASDARFVNASVGFDVEAMLPTYRLHLGVPGASGAVVVARRLGLPDSICSRATHLAGERTQLESLLMLIEGERRAIERERQLAAEQHARAEALEAQAAARLATAEERLQAARKGAHDEALETLRRARAELDRTRSVLRRSADGVLSPAELQSARREIDEAAQVVHESAPKPVAPEGRPASLDELRPGLEVWVRRLGGRALVLTVKGQKVTVQAGLLKATVQLDEILIPSGAPTLQASQRSRRGHSGFDGAPPELGRPRGRWQTLDVRGERVDAAIGMAEKFLDDALRAGHEGVLVVHGHGTGALRDRLREHLRGFPGVSGVEPAQPNEGGDGATVILL